ncbi:junctional adhesion molecule C [Xiphophorus maculatus]|uniref:Junctional adhesion molecule 3 n=1 Tax=Xiphophorus maculatus TaxID=8083 RepID=A0A3B5QBI0_XIPMA|nr:junctional adhesion molecule C [Xiphophorus maculatus]XP_032401987.1 junctional adhesion molecule C [Xiphophorus hellerii]
MKRCKMAMARLVACIVLYTSLGHIPSSLGVILRTTDKIVWANEFEPIELTCLIESISTNNPRIEWKKIKNGIPSYVYFQNKISGDLENRAQLREPANILIFNTSRADTAEYRCEVAAIEDQRDFDEILISLAVRVKPVVPRCSVPESVTVGTSTELRCLENEGFPAPQYRWFHNNEELPQDPKTSQRFVNFSYIINPDTGSLKFRRVRKEDAGEYYCQAKNDAGNAQCSPKVMDVCDVDVLGIFLQSCGGLMAVVTLIFVIYLMKRLCCYKSVYNGNNYNTPAQAPAIDYADADEGHFRHKSSFII